MILNVSGRCDIVAFFSEWFMNRYREGYVDVRNPYYPKQVSRIFFEDVDCIVFCSKNPIPILPYIKEIKEPIIFHVTLTGYHKDIEPGIENKTKIIEAIKQLSNILGKDNVVVRYDPIFLNDTYTLSYHIRAFDRICTLLDGYVETIIVSFIDEYKNVRNNKDTLKDREFTDSDYITIGTSFSKIARIHNMKVQTCFEENNLIEFGFHHDVCVSQKLIYEKTGKVVKKWEARKCGCAKMVDIGLYNTCKHYCKYCYANYDEKQVHKHFLEHDVHSSLLVGHIKEDDVIKRRKE